MAPGLPGQGPYDNTGNNMWSYHEPLFTQEDVAAVNISDQEFDSWANELSAFDNQTGGHLNLSLNTVISPTGYVQSGFNSLQTSPLELQHTQSYIVSPLKRAGSELVPPNSNNELERTASKRSRHERIERHDDLFICTHPGCSHKASLMCEIRKHFRAAHTPEAARPHQCQYCEKRFNWPKDVRRHIKQKHKEVQDATARELPALTNQESVETEDSVVTPPAAEVKPQIAAEKKKRKISLSAVGNLVMALQSLSVGSKETDYEDDGNRFVLVTQDKTTWHKVDLDGVRTSANLMQKIQNFYHHHDGRPMSSLILYRHHPKKMDKRIPERGLLAAVRKASCAQRTLEIVLSPILSTSTQQIPGHSDPFAAVR